MPRIGGIRMEFEDWFRDKSRRLETLLIRGVLLLLFVLLVTQALQTAAGFRRLISLVDQLEGQPYGPPDGETAFTFARQAPGEEHHVVLELLADSSGIMVWVMVNGEKKAVLLPGQPLTLPVQAGDLLEVDGQMPETEMEVVVRAVSDGIVSPSAGSSVRFFGLPETLGWVTTSQNR